MQGDVQLRCGLRLPRQVSRRKLRPQRHRRFLRRQTPNATRSIAPTASAATQPVAAPVSPAIWSDRLGTCTPTPAGQPHPLCPKQDPTTCGTTGMCDGQGGCPRYPVNTACGGAVCVDATSGKSTPDLRRPRNLSDRQDLQLRKLRLHERRLHRVLLQPGRLRARACLHHPDRELGGNLRPESVRPVLQGRRRLRERALRGRRLLRHHLHGGLSQLRDSPARWGPARRSPPAGSDPHAVCKDLTAAMCATDGKCDGAGACRKYAVGTVCAARELLGEQLHAAVDLQHLRHLRSTKRHQLQPVPVQRHRLLFRLHQRPAVCVAQYLRNERRRRLLRNEAQRPTLLEQQPVHERAVCPGRLLRHGLQHRLSRLQHRR